MMKARELIKFSLNPRVVEDSALPVGYIRNAFYNGLGRYVPQLQRVTIKFCKNSHSSKGVRKFVEGGLLDYSRKNPGVVVYLKPRFHKTPVIVGEYLNGQRQWMNIRNFSDFEVEQWLEIFRTRSGYELTQLILTNNVITPSVQGVWNPYLNRPEKLINSEMPNAERNEFIPDVPSATQQLVDLVEKLKLEESNTTQN